VRLLPAGPDPDLSRLVVSSDGSARGNPGPAGIGVEIRSLRGDIVEQIAQGIGVATNNVAEYTAAIEGLRRAADLGASEVVLRSDSRLLIEQLAGRFRVKNPTLQRLHREATHLIQGFQTVRLEHVPREQNRAADRLANQGVDAWLAGRGRGFIPARRPPRLWGDDPDR
jgi:ribonuclease HI